MATNPRAGIINLNFKDVSEMAKNIADNDPWKLGIDAAGKVLTDRERYIMYQRALADAQGKERPEDKTAGELIGSGIDGVGSALSWLGDKAGKGIDKLRALMPSETIEKSYEEGELTESPIFQGEMSQEDPFAGGMSREQSMSKLQAPEEPMGVNVSFPTTVVGKDREIERPRREVGGKFDWTFPNKGYETEFPTTVVGAPEDTKEPAVNTAVVAPEKAQEATSPFGSTEVAETKIKAPRMSEMEAWSEMNRLDPQRATFDYNRVQNQKKADIETLKALGKDANLDDIRATHNAYLQFLATLEQRGVQPDDPRYLAAKKNVEFTAGLMADRGLLPTTDVDNPTETPEEKKLKEANIKTARDKADEIITKELVDADNDGYVDTGSATIVKKKLSDLALEYNININDQKWKDVYDWYDTKANALEKATKGKREKADEARRNSEFARKLADDRAAVGALALAYKKLQTNPNDKTYKSSALTSILRKESGASIGSSEFMGRMKEWLSPSDYQSLQDDMSGVGMLIAGKLSDNAADIWGSKIADKYLDKVNSDKLFEFVGAILPDYAKTPAAGGAGAGAGKAGSNTYPMRQTKNGIKYIKKSANSAWEREA